MNIFSIILARTETLFFGIGSTKNHQSMIIVPNTFNYFRKFSRQRLPLYMLLLYVLALKQIYQIFTCLKNCFFKIFCIRKFTFFLKTFHNFQEISSKKNRASDTSEYPDKYWNIHWRKLFARQTFRQFKFLPSIIFDSHTLFKNRVQNNLQKQNRISANCPANIYLFNIHNRNTKKGVNYVQS